MSEEIARKAKLMNDSVDSMNRAFEMYKDKVQDLEDTCESFEKLCNTYKRDNEALRLFLSQVKHLVTSEDKSSHDKILSLFEGIIL